jgi:hypothetical protein
MKRVAAALALSLVACGFQSATVGSDSSNERSAALSAPQVSMYFAPDWSTSVSQPLTAGATVHITYDVSRLPQCRGDQDGHPAWSITAYWQLDSGASGSLTVGGYGLSSPSFTVPSAGELQLWFQITDVWGCSAWDSKFGENYRFTVGAAPPVIHFLPGWVTQVDGTLTGAPLIAVDYDVSRLPKCRATYNGLPAWSVAADWSFDGGRAQTADVSQGPAIVAVPQDARELQLWFEGSDDSGCTTWDSLYGQNYRFTLR